MRLAISMNPPRQVLEFKDIIGYSFLAEFDLLREGRQDVREKPWTKPIFREGMEQYFKLKCARDEQKRLDIEVRRLSTHIRDEEHDYRTAIETQLQKNPPLAKELQRRWSWRKAVNDIHLLRLQRICDLPESTAVLSPGHRIGRTHASRLSTLTIEGHIREDDNEEDAEDSLLEDGHVEETEALQNWLAS